MKSFPYNAIITKSPEVIDSLFFPTNRQRISFDQFIRDLPEEDKSNLLVLSPGRGYGFLELDINFPEGGGVNNYVNLKMVDTSEIVDFFVVDRHPVDNEVIRRLERSDNFFKDKIQKLIKNSGRFYLSFGVGDDLRKWSGPYSMQISNAVMNVNADGVREIDLGFIPNPESIKVFTNRFFNDAGYAQLESKFDSKSRKNKEIEIRTDCIFDVENGSLPVRKPGGDSRWNYWVRRVVAGYLNNLYPGTPVGNILPLFGTDLDRPAVGSSDITNGIINIPNVNEKTILDHAKNLAKLGILITVEEEVKESKPKKDQTEKVLQQKRGPNSTIDSGTVDSPVDAFKQETIPVDPAFKSGTISVDAAPLDPSRFVAGESDNERTNRIARERRELNSLTRGGRSIPRSSQPPSREEILNRLADGISQPVVESKVARQNPDYLAETDNLLPPVIKKAKMTMMHRWKAEDTSDSLNTLMAPLYTFYRGVRQRRSKNIQFTMFEETDSHILKFLKESNVIEDETKPVIVFGEKEIIKNLMYPAQEYATVAAAHENNEFKDFQGSAAGSEVGFESTFTYNPTGRLGDWPRYSKKFVNHFYNSVRGRTSSFGEAIDFGPFTKSLKDKVKGSDLVFMHNVKNTNVLDVRFENVGYYASLLSLAAESKLLSVANNKATSEIISDNRLGLSEIAEYVSKKTKDIPKDDIKLNVLEMLKKDKGLKRLVFLKDDLKNTKVVDFLDVITFLVTGDALPSPGPVVKVRPGERHKVYADVLEDISKYTINADVRTVPFFNQPKLFGRECFLFGLSNKVVGSILDKTKTYAPFTGRYLVVGTRHYMSSNDAFSSFKLLRIDAVGNPTQESLDILNMTIGEFVGEFMSYMNVRVGEEEDLEKLAQRGEERGLFIKPAIQRFVNYFKNLFTD
tara:strand:+ start:4666 stop:7395 length:2730 start_codon:yes stop_codon:yes gene_type:complete